MFPQGVHAGFWAVFGKFHRGFDHSVHLSLNPIKIGLGGFFAADQHLGKTCNRVVVLGFRHFGLAALHIWVTLGVATIAISLDFQEVGALAVTGMISSTTNGLTDGHHVGAIFDNFFGHAVAIGLAGDVCRWAVTQNWRAHGELVVLDQKHDRAFPHLGPV